MKHQPQTKNTSHKEQKHKLEKKESHKEQKYQLQEIKTAKKRKHFSHTEKVHQAVKQQTQRTREQLRGEKNNHKQQVNSSSKKKKPDYHSQMAIVRFKVDPKQRCKSTSKCTNTFTCKLHMHVL